MTPGQARPKPSETRHDHVDHDLPHDTQAEEAAQLYTSLLNGTVKETMRYPAGGPRPEGSVLSVTFELFGQTYIALNGGPTLTFSSGFSLMVQVDTQAEIDRLWAKLTENGGKEVQVTQLPALEDRASTRQLTARRDPGPVEVCNTRKRAAPFAVTRRSQMCRESTRAALTTRRRKIDENRGTPLAEHPLA